MQRFDGKVVIVTGAASGIGEATARRFSSEGARVALVDRNEAPLADVAKDCRRNSRWPTSPTFRIMKPWTT